MPVIGRISVGDGATFTPSVSSAGELSWTNNKNLPNPETVDLAQAVIDSGAGLFLPVTGGTVTGSVEVTGGVTADITGDVTGNLTGNVTGNVTGDVTGDVTGVASGNLPLTGGTVTGNLSVSGTITGNLTGNVTGNADTATKATNDGNGNNIASTYLTLTGGTITGDLTVNGDFTHEETATLLGSSTTQETSVLFDATQYKSIYFRIDIQYAGEDFVRGNGAEYSVAALQLPGAKTFNFGSTIQNHASCYIIYAPSYGVTYWAGGVSSPTGTITSIVFKVYGIK